MQSVPITSKVVSSNPADGKVYSIQHYVIKFVSDLRQVGGFLRVLLLSSTNKTDRHNITEILLKVALSTLTLYSIFLQFGNSIWLLRSIMFSDWLTFQISFTQELYISFKCYMKWRIKIPHCQNMPKMFLTWLGLQFMFYLSKIISRWPPAQDKYLHRTIWQNEEFLFSLSETTIQTRLTTKCQWTFTCKNVSFFVWIVNSKWLWQQDKFKIGHWKNISKLHCIILWKYWTICMQTWWECSFDCLYLASVFCTDKRSKRVTTARQSFSIVSNEKMNTRK